MGSSGKNNDSGGKGRSTGAASTLDSAQDRYRIEALIGSGATSRVYRAWDNRDRREVALKILDSEINEEWETLASLSSQPCIVRLYERGWIPDPADANTQRFFISMELLEGLSIEQNPPVLRDIGVVKQIIQGCCRALAAAHVRGVLHCDIKPSNVFVTLLRTGHYSGVTVLDFGLASRLSSQATLASGGTYAYMSPEQISGTRINEASDVFSLGILAYQMLAGRHPFFKDPKSATKDELQIAITTATAEAITELNPAVPEAMALVVHRALAKDPGQRPSARDIDRLLDQKDVLQREWREAEKALVNVRKAFDEGDFARASDELRVLEHRGLAFHDIVVLRHQLDCSREDEIVRAQIAKTRHTLDDYDIEAAKEELRAAQQITSRRFDVRVLGTEAELEFRACESSKAVELVDSATKAFDAGSLRKAEWLLQRLEHLKSASPFALGRHSSSAVADAITARIKGFYGDEAQWLRDGLGFAGTQSDGSIQAQTPAKQARELEMRAQRHKPVLEKALELLRVSDIAEQDRLVQELQHIRSNDPGDVVQDLVNLFQLRKSIIESLRRQVIESEVADDLASVLQALESLASIVPSADLPVQSQDIENRSVERLERDRRATLLANLEFLASTGNWSTADTVLHDSRGLADSEELRRISMLIRERVSESSSISEHVATHLDHLRHYEIDRALEQLQSALDLDPGNKVFALSLASLKYSKAARLDQEHLGEAYDLRSQAEALLEGFGANWFLAAAYQDLTQMRPIVQKDGTAAESLPQRPSVIALPTRSPVPSVEPLRQEDTTNPESVPVLPEPVKRNPYRWVIVCFSSVTVALIVLVLLKLFLGKPPVSEGKVHRVDTVAQKSVLPANDEAAARIALAAIERQVELARTTTDAATKGRLIGEAHAAVDRFNGQYSSGSLQSDLQSRLRSSEQGLDSIRVPAATPAGPESKANDQFRPATQPSAQSTPPAPTQDSLPEALTSARDDLGAGHYVSALGRVRRFSALPEAKNLIIDINSGIGAEIEAGSLNKDEARGLLRLSDRLIDSQTRRKLQDWTAK